MQLNQYKCLCKHHLPGSPGWIKQISKDIERFKILCMVRSPVSQLGPVQPSPQVQPPETSSHTPPLLQLQCWPQSSPYQPWAQSDTHTHTHTHYRMSIKLDGVVYYIDYSHCGARINRNMCACYPVCSLLPAGPPCTHTCPSLGHFVPPRHTGPPWHSPAHSALMGMLVEP